MADYEENYRNLAAAIILQAGKDYRNVLKKKTLSLYDKSLKIDLERFFQSDWFTVISDLDGRMIMEKIQEGVGV